MTVITALAKKWTLSTMRSIRKLSGYLKLTSLICSFLWNIPQWKMWAFRSV